MKWKPLSFLLTRIKNAFHLESSSSRTTPGTSWPTNTASGSTRQGKSPVCSTAASSSNSRKASKALCQPINRSEEHTSELQSLTNLVCRILLEKKKLKRWRGLDAGNGSGRIARQKNQQHR